MTAGEDDVEVEVVDVSHAHRFEVHVDGAFAGFTLYRQKQARVAFTHTEVDDRFEGMGLGGRLVRGALDEMRGRGTQVLPYCPFVQGFIQRHPEYADLVPADLWADFGLERG